MRTVVTLLLLGALLGPLVWWLTRPPLPADVTVVSVEKGDVKLIVNGSSAGEVMPEQRTMVRGEVPGTVEKVLHKRGDRVKKADVIVALDTRDARARVAQAEAALEAAEVGVTSAQTRVNGAEKTRARMQQLVDKGSAPKAELERLELEKDAAVDGVKAAQAQVKQMESALLVARIALQRMEMRAPFNGVLQDVMANVGQQVTPGVPVFDIVDDSRLYIQVPIDEVDAPRVQVGQPVMVTFDSLHSREVQGVIRTVAPAIGRDEKLARTLRVEVELTEPPPMRVGMAANVAVVERVVTGVNVLPTLSVQGRGMERSVLVVEDVDAEGVGTIHRRKIKVGVSNDELTEVVSGLEPRDRVVQAPNDPGIRENMRAKPVALGKTVQGLVGLQDGRAPVPVPASSTSGSP